MKLLRKRLAWVLVAACEWVVLVAALRGDTFSWNLLLFLTGLAAVGAFCDLWMMGEAPKVRERAVPRWLLGAHALLFVMVAAGFGHFWMAAFWLAAYALDGARYSKHHETTKVVDDLTEDGYYWCHFSGDAVLVERSGGGGYFYTFGASEVEDPDYFRALDARFIGPLKAAVHVPGRA